MLKSHEKFHSTNGKRLVLIADDEAINRRILGAVIEKEYEVLYAENGVETMELIREYKDTLSLVLLDLLMPKMSGIEVLKEVREDSQLKHVPIIVVTTDQAAEVESLTLGATDFISKPYPQPDVILARLLRTIELSEDRDIISSTERDQLTGLYNKEFFYRYAEQFDTFHKDRSMDAIVIDVNHFHMLNERYGREYGDQILRRIGEKIRGAIDDKDGLVGRREADAFLVYCVHGCDYEDILEKASIGIEENEDSAGTRVRLRMGVYPNVDRHIDIERRFDRAKMAADRIRNNYTQKFAIYDNTLHETELYAEQLTGDFQKAIAEQQFHVYYQPKFDVRGETPVLSSAEALVRWIHPELGMISPGRFIPLFEENGMIRQLDHYVWRTTAAQIRDWKDRYGISIPVSVNMSRVDMFDESLLSTMQGLMKEFGLTPKELLLEITESAYTDDSELIIRKVSQLRGLGFRIEMDDFGTGYSSLGMISNLPIDALKLDMMFVRNAFNERKNVKMLELIMDLARHLDVPVIAEGVETGDQMRSLKAMGCDLVQGYYFSKPVPAEEFERFVVELAAQKAGDAAQAEDEAALAESALKYISSAMTSDFESIYFVDTDTGYYMEFGTNIWRNDLQLEKGGTDFFADMSRGFISVLHPEDQERIRQFLDKDYLLERLEKETIISLSYRLLIGDAPVYHRLQAVLANSRNKNHIIIGVRSVDQEAQKTLDEERIQAENVEIYEVAQSLENRYETIYYVDRETDAYTVFNASERHDELKIANSGIHFYEDVQHTIARVVYPADRELMYEGLKREAVQNALEQESGFTIDYRLVFDGKPEYYRMVGFLPAVGDDHHYMVGVYNVNEEKSSRMHFASEEDAIAAYAMICRSLTQDFLTVYDIDQKNDQYVEYSMNGTDHRLRIERAGDDFFRDSARMISGRVLPEDRDRVMKAFAKEQLLQNIAEGGSEAVYINYRTMRADAETCVEAKMLRSADDPGHIIIGLAGRSPKQ